ncbi:MAG TPA: GAF domain-containing protein, partial [Gemmatimonadaceae bacterium]|nr:GAF domain-containing protein [Gemmatimonadaceae bacterium]
ASAKSWWVNTGSWTCAMPSASIEAVVARLKQIVASSASRETKAKLIADTVREYGNHRWVGVYDVNPNEIAAVAWSGPAAPAHPRFPIDHGLSAAAVKTGCTVIANDVSKDARYLRTLETTGAEMIVPVTNGARVIGTLDLESETVGRFGESDRVFVECCADAIRGLWESA